MNDQELYDYFKTRSAAFNELPSAGLWNKIQSSMEATANTNPSKAAITKFILLLVLASLLTALCFNALKNEMEEAKPVVPVNKIETVNAATIQQSKKEEKVITKAIPQKPMTKSFSKNENGAVKNGTLGKVQKTQQLIQPTVQSSENNSNDSLIETKVYKNRIVIRSKKILSDTEFDELTQKILKDNEGEFNLLIIVMAPGHPTFRKQLPLKPLTTKTIGFVTHQPIKSNSTIALDSLKIIKQDTFNLKFEKPFKTKE